LRPLFESDEPAPCGNADIGTRGAAGGPSASLRLGGTTTLGRLERVASAVEPSGGGERSAASSASAARSAARSSTVIGSGRSATRSAYREPTMAARPAAQENRASIGAPCGDVFSVA
jgi:hypothetical protein